MKWIRVRIIRQGKPTGKAFWVSEKNKYFDWYKKHHLVLREVKR